MLEGCPVVMLVFTAAGGTPALQFADMSLSQTYATDELTSASPTLTLDKHSKLRRFPQLP